MLRRPTSIKLVELFGIRIGADGSWFVILFLMIFWLSGDFRQTLHSSDAVAYLTTVITVLVLFGSLVVHELGHALVARAHGIGVRRIDLFLFGGLTQMSRDAATPAEDFQIAVAGPLATFGFAAVCLVISLLLVGPDRVLHAVELDGSVPITPVVMSLSWLLLWNVLLLAFNLIPAFPLDGGRIARSIVWRITGQKERGTRVAALLGQGFAVILAGLGVWLLAAYLSFTALWLIAIAFLLWQSARGALVQTALSERIAEVRVSDVMDSEPVAIPSETPVGRAIDEFFLRYGWTWFPVVDERGHFLGIARRERLEAAQGAGESWLTVGSVLEAEGTASWRVGEERPLSEALASESLGQLGAVMAVDGDGVLRGVLTLGRVRRALQATLGSAAG
jgi:Zn-dependent protease